MPWATDDGNLWNRKQATLDTTCKIRMSALHALLLGGVLTQISFQQPLFQKLLPASPEFDWVLEKGLEYIL